MVASPCTGVCTLDPTTGFCLGCLRTRDEIALWSGADDALRQQILERTLEREAPDSAGVSPSER